MYVRQCVAKDNIKSSTMYARKGAKCRVISCRRLGICARRVLALSDIGELETRPLSTLRSRGRHSAVGDTSEAATG
jgi:hypothetical protein